MMSRPESTSTMITWHLLTQKIIPSSSLFCRYLNRRPIFSSASMVGANCSGIGFEDRTAELFLRWNAGDRFFEAIDIDDQCEIFSTTVSPPGVLQLDSEDAAVYLWEVRCRWLVWDFAVYRFAEETGYECVLHTGSPHVDLGVTSSGAGDSDHVWLVGWLSRE